MRREIRIDNNIRIIRIIRIINVCISIFVLLLLFFVSSFWIGTQKQHEEIINENLFSFIMFRVLLNLFFVLVSIAVLWIINIGLKHLFKLTEYNILKTIVFESIIYVLSSIAFVIIGAIWL